VEVCDRGEGASGKNILKRLPKHLLLGIDQPVQTFPLTIKPKIKIILNE
jgi:hypothetical protein